MSDIHRACKHFHFHPILFADDTNLTSSPCSFNEEQNTPDRIVSLPQVINSELKEIQKWPELNKIALNVEKTKYMLFHNHQRDIINHIPKLELSGEYLVRVEDFIFLGLTIDLECIYAENIKYNLNIFGNYEKTLTISAPKYITHHIKQLNSASYWLFNSSLGG